MQLQYLDDFEKETLYPRELEDDHEAITQYASAIYSRLEEFGVLDASDDTHAGLLIIYNDKRDGYHLLQAILTASLGAEKTNIGTISTPPIVQSDTNPYWYAALLKEFFDSQARRGRYFSPREQTIMFLHNTQNIPTYQQTVAPLLYEFDHLPTNDDGYNRKIPSRFEGSHHFSLTDVPYGR